MSNTVIFNPPFPTLKRSACDRCRVQKLRCPPRERDSEPCTRCVRQGAQCITSYPRPTGRAPKANIASSNTNESSDTPKESSETTASAAQPQQSQSAPAPGACDPFTLSTSDDQLDILGSKLPLSGSMMFLDDMIFDDAGKATQYFDFSAFPPLPTASQMDSHVLPLAIPPMTDNSLRGDQRLSSLNLELSRQLQECNMVTEHGELAMPDVGSNSPLDREKTAKAVQEKSTFSKLLREALSRSLEFLDIIQSHSPERRNSFQEMAPGKETSPNTRPGIVFKLNLLSVYLQLVMIYEKIIHLLRACLLEELLVEIPDLEIAPGGQMGNNMQIKLLIHAILHQFELIEQILGLPAECRVTDKDGVYPGVRLLEDSNTKSLLEAVGFGKGSEVTGIDDHGSRILTSLRDGLRNVQIALNMI